MYYGLRDAQGPFDSESLLTQAGNAYLTRLCAFSAAAIVVYDTIVTFDREVELIWQKRWSLIKAVYLWFRYFGLLCAIFQAVAFASDRVNDKFCHFWFRWEVISYITLALCSEILLILWIWVTHNHSRRLLIFLVVLWIAQAAGEVVLMVIGLDGMEAEARTVGSITFCTVVRGGHWSLKLLWVPVMVFFLVTTAIFVRSSYYAYFSRSSAERFGVLKMVVEHTTLNYLAMTSAYIICAVIWLSATPSLAQIPVCFVLALSVTDCTRLLINIRRGYYHADDPDALTIQSQWSRLSFDVGRFTPSRRRRKDSFGFDADELAVAVEIEVTQQVEEATETDQYEMQKIDHTTITSVNNMTL